MSRAVFIVLLLSVVVCYTNAGCVPTRPCGKNEFWNTCASQCPPTCAVPKPTGFCIQSCRVGCDCREGYMRSTRGFCVPRAQCH